MHSSSCPAQDMPAQSNKQMRVDKAVVPGGFEQLEQAGAFQSKQDRVAVVFFA